MEASIPSPLTVEAIRKVPLFRQLDEAAMAELCGLVQTQQVVAGTKLFQTGDAGDAMYLVQSGRVQISVADTEGRDVILADLRHGEFFGELALLDGRVRSADAVVRENATLTILPRPTFQKFLDRRPGIAVEMLGAVAQRLRRTDELLRHRVSRNANEEQAASVTLADRAADIIAEFGGSWKFIGAAMAFLILWVVLNTWLLSNKGFDPFPYVLLNLVLGMITGLQAPIIMMSQNRQAQKDRVRADLDYRVNLKNELLLSEILRRLDALQTEQQEALQSVIGHR